MARKIDEAQTLKGHVRLPSGVTLKPPVTAEDLRVDTEHDPAGAEAFVDLIRAIRSEGSRPLNL